VKDRAFTLLEVVISVVILAVGVLAFMGMVRSSKAAVEISEQRGLAVRSGEKLVQLMTSELMQSSLDEDLSLPLPEQRRMWVADGQIHFQKVSGDAMNAGARTTVWSDRITYRHDEGERAVRRETAGGESVVIARNVEDFVVRTDPGGLVFVRVDVGQGGARHIAVARVRPRNGLR